MSKRLSDALAGWLFVAILIGVIVFAAIPLVVGTILSFDDRDFLAAFPPPRYSLRWYRAFFGNDYYIQGLWTSLTVAGVATLVAMVIGVLSALFISRYRFHGREALQAFLLSPLMIPHVIIGFSILIFAAALDIYDGFTRLIMGHCIFTIPYAIRTTLASLVGIKPSLVEAALSLGANDRQAFLDVTLPLARTGIVAGGIFAFVMSFDEVGISIFLSDAFNYTLPVALLAEMRANLNYTIAAVSVIFMALTIVVIFLLDWLVGLDRIVGQGVYRA